MQLITCALSEKVRPVVMETRRILENMCPRNKRQQSADRHPARFPARSLPPRLAHAFLPHGTCSSAPCPDLTGMPEDERCTPLLLPGSCDGKRKKRKTRKKVTAAATENTGERSLSCRCRKAHPCVTGDPAPSV